MSTKRGTLQEKGRLFVVDGTGFSYHDIYPMKIFNGMDIRKIKTHVKAGVVIGFVGMKRYVVSASAGKSYTGDTVLIQPLLEKLPKGKGSVLGDKGFDSRRIMATIEDKGYLPVIPIKRHRSFSPQDPMRIRSSERASIWSVYKQRTLIEGLFGNVKQKLGSHARVFKLEIAKLFALLRFALLNVSVLITIENTIAGIGSVMWVGFPNSAIYNCARK